MFILRLISYQAWYWKLKSDLQKENCIRHHVDVTEFGLALYWLKGDWQLLCTGIYCFGELWKAGPARLG